MPRPDSPAFAMVYFAWPYEADGLAVPASHHNIPIEELDRARAWLAERAEADVGRIGLVGNSKGGEFAMVGAATLSWVRGGSRLRTERSRLGGLWGRPFRTPNREPDRP